MAAQISRIIKFVILLLLVQWTSGQLVRLSSGIEWVALYELRSSLGLRSRDWPRKSDPCSTWVGVQCRNDGRVIGINVSGLRRTRLGLRNPQFSVDSLSNFTVLTSFNASGFSLPGPIPDWFGEKFSSLRVLDLRSCSVTDPIPILLGNLTNLSSLYLSGNEITGTIPETLGQLSQLSILDLSQNLITGSIPSSFGSLTNLSLLDLSSNFLSGPIPPSIGTLQNLLFLNLSNNSLSASIPAQIGDLSRLVDLDLSINSLSGSLPMELRGLRSMKRMMVGRNSLAGALPDNLFSSLTQLQIVVLSRNNLSGALPDFFWSMPELLFLDASYNNFTGVLPNRNLNENVSASARVFNLSNNQLYGTLDFNLGNFSFIDLSGNYFEGKVADNTLRNSFLPRNCLQNVLNQRSLEDCTLFYTDRGLIFDNFGLPNSTQPPAAKPDRKSKKKWIYILVGTLGGLCVIVLLVLVLVMCLRRRKRGVADQTRGSDTPPPVGITPGPSVVSKDFSSVGEVFTYEQLLRATSDFSDSNLIKHGHLGDLFRGVLEGGTLVVIKRIDVRLMKKDSYMVELEFFSRVSHIRLVPFLGHCLGHENEKLLVYKYMLNGDLCSSLYRKTNDDDDESLQTLDWITRLKVAIGAAEGLSYLHHECSPPLVHRDVQASSILLDDKFEVRLGSLSEICAQEGDIHHSVITRLLRLPQSSEQGSSGSSSASCAYDVYCFGKVLLELVTGKLGISSSSDAATNEWLEHTLPFISIYEKELVTKIVDSSLIVDEDLLEEVWAMAIVAKSCLNPKPSKRPLMRYVLKALENPLKVVREENTGSARLRTTSSRGSWNASVFGSWRHSSSDITGAPGTTTTKEGGSNLRQLGTIGSQGSGQCGAGDLSSSNKKPSSDIFPEPSDLPDIERPKED